MVVSEEGEGKVWVGSAAEMVVAERVLVWRWERLAGGDRGDRSVFRVAKKLNFRKM